MGLDGTHEEIFFRRKIISPVCNAIGGVLLGSGVDFVQKWPPSLKRRGYPKKVKKWPFLGYPPLIKDWLTCTGPQKRMARGALSGKILRFGHFWGGSKPSFWTPPKRVIFGGILQKPQKVTKLTKTPKILPPPYKKFLGTFLKHTEIIFLFRK